MASNPSRDPLIQLKAEAIALQAHLLRVLEDW